MKSRSRKDSGHKRKSSKPIGCEREKWRRENDKPTTHRATQADESFMVHSASHSRSTTQGIQRRRRDPAADSQEKTHSVSTSMPLGANSLQKPVRSGAKGEPNLKPNVVVPTCCARPHGILRTLTIVGREHVVRREADPGQICSFTACDLRIHAEVAVDAPARPMAPGKTHCCAPSIMIGNEQDLSPEISSLGQARIGTPGESCPHCSKDRPSLQVARVW
jgi:hypothetical protein